METATTIIPIASGKGGVGKTLFAANLCIALARLGHDTVAVDMDFGGSNLYTCLGVPNKYPGIGEFLKTGKPAFQNLMVPTGIPNLRFIPGEGRTPFLANISHEQRLVLVQEIKKIKARYVVLDLGAGTTFSTLNFFGMVAKGVMITTFETPAIMNFVMFLRNFIFRVISGVARKDKKCFDSVVSAFERSITDASVTANTLILEIEKHNRPLADLVRKTCAGYRPRIVFNMGDHPHELAILDKLQSTLWQGLSMEADYFGFVFHDEAVRRSAKNREVLITRYPDSPASKGIARIAQRVVRLWDEPSLEGRFDLMENTKLEFRHWKSASGPETRGAGV